MDSFSTITIFNYNLKLLLRNKLLFIIFFFIYALITYLQLRRQSDLFSALPVSFADASSFIPYMNMFFFSIFQLLPLIMISCTLLYKEQKVETLEAIYYRKESNHDYIWGCSLAIITLFVGFGIVSLIIATFIHSCASEATFQIGIYVFYLLTLTLPSIVYVLGLSLLVCIYIKHQGLGQIILWLYIFVTLFYIQDIHYGLFDFLGTTLPNTFSDLTGHPDISTYLLQRGCYFFLGIGFIELTIIHFNRIPNTPFRLKEKILTVSFIGIGLALGTLFFTTKHNAQALRQVYANTYNKYASAPKATLLSQNIKYTQKEKQIAVNSELVIHNQSNTPLESIILYLNPKLEIVSIKNGNTVLNHVRDHQVIKINKQLAINDSLHLHITYKGGIDENICYVDFPEHVTSNTGNNVHLACRFGQRYAYLEKDYTLLIPEILWYPTTVPPVNPAFPSNFELNFTKYTLQVPFSKKSKAISQGKRNFRDKFTIFTNENPLPGISLCIGDYDTFSYTFDSVLYEVSVARKHAYLLKSIVENKNFTIAKVIPQIRQIMENQAGKKFPYTHLKLTETPSSFTSYYRNERNSSEFVQAELIFCPERFFTLQVRPGEDIHHAMISELKHFFLSDSRAVTPFSWENLFNRYISDFQLAFIKITPDKNYTITSLFYNKMLHIQSEEFPFINSLLNAILQDNNATSIRERLPLTSEQEAKAIDYLKTRSLQDAFTDARLNNSELDHILILKSRELLDYFNTRGVCIDTLVDFIFEFQNKYKFQQIDFDSFNQDFKNSFNLSFDKIIKQWLSQNQIPRYLIDVSTSHLIPGKNGIMVRTVFAVFNDSDVDGIIRVGVSKHISTRPPKYDIMQALTQKNIATRSYSYEIKARSGKQFALTFENASSISLNTNISHNWPNQFTLSTIKNAGSDTACYTRPVSKDIFLPDSNEIIVDNEDQSCLTTQEGSKLIGLFKKETNFFEDNNIIFPTDQWKKINHQNCHGMFTRSALFKKAGSGKANVEWSTKLRKSGNYDIMVFLPANVFNKQEKGEQQKYIIRHGQEESIVYIDNPTWKSDWISLGTFQCLQGECSVILCDEGIPGQVIIGDAVKWNYVNKN